MAAGDDHLFQQLQRVGHHRRAVLREYPAVPLFEHSTDGKRRTLNRDGVVAHNRQVHLVESRNRVAGRGDTVQRKAFVPDDMDIALRSQIEGENHVRLVREECRQRIVRRRDLDIDAYFRIDLRDMMQEIRQEAVDQAVHRDQPDMAEIDTLHLFDVGPDAVLVGAPPTCEHDKHFTDRR